VKTAASVLVGLGIVTALGSFLALSAQRASASQSSALSGFHTPGWAAQCVVGENFAGPPPLICWTPNDGFTVRMQPSGRASKRYVRFNRGYRDRLFARRLLNFGQHWRFRLQGVTYFRCTSRRTGVTCRNSTGHGWWLGRYRGYRIF
jgi:hypothetical protein